MIAEPLSRVLESTGYLVAGEPAAPSVSLVNGGGPRRLRSLRPDAMWRSTATGRMNGADGAVDLSAFFKYAGTATDAMGAVAGWQQDVWNHGFGALLWVVWTDRVEIYNGFGKPRPAGEEGANLLGTFDLGDSGLAALDSFAGRLAMETGEFWVRQGHRVDRKTGVDAQLLEDLRGLESSLVKSGLDHQEAQGLIGRTIFANYLIDREVVTTDRLRELCDGRSALPDIMSDRDAAICLFEWLRDEFNGDMFSASRGISPEAVHLHRVASFLRAEDPETGQLSLFPYRFDVIPVELISSIYESFVHSTAPTQQETDETDLAEDAHYTPLTAVSMVLDQVFDGLTGDETVIDLTCGSGVFLVESLRRLVRLKVRGRTPDRATIRKVLYEQIYGVDKSEAAIRIAAFSLYLAALELDPDPKDRRSRGFRPLKGRTLLVGDARTIDQRGQGKRILTTASGLKRFDVIVGNPPWSYRGKTGTAVRAESSTPLPPRGQGFDFIHRGIDFSHQNTRFGVLVSALPFFSRSSTGANAAHHLVESLGSVTLINLAELSNWLFPRANMPAMAVLARNRHDRTGSMRLVQARRSLKTDRSHTIELTSSAVSMLPVSGWKRNTGLCKAAFLGHKNDLLLADRLWNRFGALGDRLRTLGTRLAAGLTLGSPHNRTRDARFLANRNLPFLPGGRMERFALPAALPPFTERQAQWPRTLATYRAPLVVVKEYITKTTDAQGLGRAVVAVSERDLVYNDSYYGISLRDKDQGLSYLLAGILSSGLASWFFLMTGSTFGAWQQRLLLGDIKALPTPNLDVATKTKAGKRIVELVQGFHSRVPDASGWDALDDLVCDLYQLDQEERIVVQDGWLRSTWEWSVGRDAALSVATTDDLENYAKAFLLSMDAWLRAANARSFSAEIYEFSQGATYRVVRFTLENRPPPSSQIKIARPRTSVRDFLGQVGVRLGRDIQEELVGSRELRLHSRSEVFVVKPAARRFWLGVSGLDDARAVMMESVTGRKA